MELDIGGLFWKQIWRECNGYHKQNTCDAVEQWLTNVKNELISGILQYKKTSSDETFYDFVNRMKVSDTFQKFLQRFMDLSDLNIKHAWQTVNVYLLYEFHGTPNTLKGLTMNIEKSGKLLQDILYFYRTQRMFSLKIMKLILEYYSNPKHPYHTAFAKIIDAWSINSIRESLIDQLSQLLMEQWSHSEDTTKDLEYSWLSRNISEQVEILHCLLLSHKVEKIDSEELQKLLKLFLCHSFGHSHNYQILLNKHNLMNEAFKITDSEIGLLLTILDGTGVDNYFWEKLKSVINQNIHGIMSEPEGTPIVLYWKATYRFYRHEELFSTDVSTSAYKILYRIVTDRIFTDKSLCGHIVRKSVYNFLRCLGGRAEYYFDNENVYKLLGVLLQDPVLADEFWIESDSGITILFDRAKELFPYNFKNITYIFTGLATTGGVNVDKVLKEAEALPVFCAQYQQSFIQGTSEKLALSKEYTALLNNTYRAPAGTSVLELRTDDKMLMQILHPVNYWNCLLNQILLMIQHMSSTEEDLFRIQSGYALAKSIYKSIRNRRIQNYEHFKFHDPVALVFDVINVLTIKKKKNMQLYASCLDLTSELALIFPEVITTKLRNSNFVPYIFNTHADVFQLTNPLNVESGHVIDLIFNVEMLNNEYHLLKSYLHFLKQCSGTQFQIENDFLPAGLIFIFEKLFARLIYLNISIGSIEQDILFECISLIFEILRSHSEMKSNGSYHEVIQKLCIHYLLRLPASNIILETISKGNGRLEMIMHRETNWISGSGIQYLYIVQMCLTILMQMFNLRNFVAKKNENMPLEQKLFGKSYEENIILMLNQIVTLMNNSFNSALPVLSCRVLRIFAMKIEISLKNCFGLDSEQIQHMFLSRIRSTEETIEMKQAIFEFITASIRYQPALLQAFFTLQKGDENLSLETPRLKQCPKESLFTILGEHLKTVKANPQYRTDPLYFCIMTLLYEMWKTRRHVLLLPLRRDPNFWTYLCSPFLSEEFPDSKSCAQILNIISVEVYSHKAEIEEQLKDFFKNFFDIEKPYIQKWCDFIYAPKETPAFEEKDFDDDDAPYEITAISAWKDFISVMSKHSQFTFDDRVKGVIASGCLQCLMIHVKCHCDNRTITVIMELYVLLVLKWKEKVFSDQKKTVSLLCTVVCLNSVAYSNMVPRMKISFLSMAIVSVSLLKDEIKKNETYASKMLEYVMRMAFQELEQLETKYKSGTVQNETDERCVNWSSDEPVDISDRLKTTVLVMHLLNNLIITCAEFPNFVMLCHRRKLLLRLVSCLGIIVQKKQELPISEALLDGMKNLACTKYVAEFLFNDIAVNLWLKLIPPKELLKKYWDPTTQRAWKIEEWWSIYQRAINLVRLLLKRLGSQFINSAMSFIEIHEEHIEDCILLERYTMDLRALQIVCSTLALITELCNYDRLWRKPFILSMTKIMVSVKICLHHCICLLLRPQTLRSTVETASEEMESDDNDPVASATLVAVINKLIDIVSEATVCLLNVSAPLPSLLLFSEIALEDEQCFLELKFHMPKISPDNVCELSFGTLISAVCLFSRSLLQHCSIKAKSSKLRTSNALEVSQMSSQPRVRNTLSLINLPRTDYMGVDVFPSSPSFTSSYTKWLRYFNEFNCKKALETILTLLAAQTIHALVHSGVSKKDKEFMCREINSELSVFYDYVKKVTKDGMIRRPKNANQLMRLKHGSEPLNAQILDLEDTINLTRSPTDITDLLYDILFSTEYEYLERGGEQSVQLAFTPYSDVKLGSNDYLILMFNLYAAICRKEDSY